MKCNNTFSPLNEEVMSEDKEKDSEIESVPEDTKDHEVTGQVILESAEHWLSALTSLNPAKLQEGFEYEGPERAKTNRNVRKRKPTV